MDRDIIKMARFIVTEVRRSDLDEDTLSAVWTHMFKAKELISRQLEENKKKGGI